MRMVLNNVTFSFLLLVSSGVTWVRWGRDKRQQQGAGSIGHQRKEVARSILILLVCLCVNEILIFVRSVRHPFDILLFRSWHATQALSPTFSLSLLFLSVCYHLNDAIWLLFHFLFPSMLVPILKHKNPPLSPHKTRGCWRRTTPSYLGDGMVCWL